MPGYVTDRAAELLNFANSLPVNGARVLLLGVTYKKDIADQRESQARPLARKLRGRGAMVSYHDPRVPQWLVDGQPVPRQDDLESALAAADLVILLQPHACYKGRPSSPAPPTYCSIPAASFRPPWRRRTSKPSDRPGDHTAGPPPPTTTTG